MTTADYIWEIVCLAGLVVFLGFIAKQRSINKMNEERRETRMEFREEMTAWAIANASLTGSMLDDPDMVHEIYTKISQQRW